jgi:hypothetical protein
MMKPMVKLSGNLYAEVANYEKLQGLNGARF